MKIFNDKPRSYEKTGDILGIKGNTIFQAQWRLKKGLDYKHNLAYKVACNCSDEFLELFLNDDNFEGFKLKKDILDNLK